jgi:hypothetical protein
VLVTGLWLALPLTFWVTYQDAESKMAKPSAAASVTLLDTFQEK